MNDNGLADAAAEQDAANVTAYTDVDDVILSGVEHDEQKAEDVQTTEDTDGKERPQGSAADLMQGSSFSEQMADLPRTNEGGPVQPEGTGAGEAEEEDAAALRANEADYTQASSALEDVSTAQQDQTFDSENNVHFVNGMGQGEDSENASSSFPRSSSARSLSHHTKRRKINTCLPCKRRKVKCDREKPHCGQCKKSSIPAEECTWSAAVDVHGGGGGVPLSAAQALFSSNSSFAASGDVTGNTSSATQWYDPANSSWNHLGGVSTANGSSTVDGATRALLERIAALETIIASSRLNVVREGAESPGENGDGNLFAQSLESDAGIAADALAMIARQTSSAVTFTNEQELSSKIRCAKMFADISTVLPAPASSAVRNAIALLPQLGVITSLLEILDNVQNHGVYVGVPVKLIKLQIENLASADVENNPIDLSVAAAALNVCAAGLDLISPEQAIELLIVDAVESIQDVTTEWSSASERLLRAIEFENRPNTNILITLALKMHLQAASGLSIAASSTLQQAIQLARGMGIDRMANQREDLAEWSSSVGEDAIQVVHAVSLSIPIYLGGKEGSSAKLPWLSRRCALVREAARSLFTHFALQDWLSDPLSSISIPASSKVPLPLPLEPIDATEPYPAQSEHDTSVLSPALLLRYQYALVRRVAAWKSEGRLSNSIRTVEKAIASESRPAAFQSDAIDLEGGNTVAVQNMRAWTELVRSYCLFVLQRAEAASADQCVESAVQLLQSRAALGASFVAPLHKFFDVQRYTLEAALMVVIYLHQYGAQNSEERRQALQSLIDEAYAQPGFENAHSLLSLSLDVQEDVEAQTVNGNKRPAPDDESVLASGQDNDGGLRLSNGRRLSSSHPIVIGLRMFVHGQSLPFGNAMETTEFWDAIGRHSQLFLVA